MPDNNEKCINCYHFKTMVVTTTSITHLHFRPDKNLQAVLEKDGYARIWYCKYKMLPSELLVNEQYARRVNKPDCEKKDYDDQAESS